MYITIQYFQSVDMRKVLALVQEKPTSRESFWEQWIDSTVNGVRNLNTKVPTPNSKFITL